LQAEHFKEAADGTLQRVGVSYGHVSHPYPREYASFEPDLDRLARAALAGGGSVDPAPVKLFDPAGEKIRYSEPLWGRFLMLALAAFLLDLLLRRVRLFDRKFVLPARAVRK
jgi:hypothetical protein